MNYQEIVNRYLARDIPHSDAYIAGAVAGLKGMSEKVPTNCEYKCGTPECDAFFYGRLKGMELYEIERSKDGIYY